MLHVHHGGERDHLATGGAAHIELADVIRLLAIIRFGLHKHAVEPAKPVEVVDISAAERSLQGVEDVGDRHAELAHLLAVYVQLESAVSADRTR